MITSPAAATDPLPVPLAFGSASDGASDAAQKTWAVQRCGGPCQRTGQGRVAGRYGVVRVLGERFSAVGFRPCRVSHRPSSELTPALVDAVFHPAANSHEKLTGVGDEFPDALV